MLTSEERLTQMLANKNNALRAFTERSDGAEPAQKEQLRHRWEDAESKLTQAETDGLKKNAAGLDAAVGSLAEANDAAKEALDELKTTVEVLNKLQQAAALAGQVLVAAA